MFNSAQSKISSIHPKQLARDTATWVHDHPYQTAFYGSTGLVVAVPAIVAAPALGAAGFGAGGVVGGTFTRLDPALNYLMSRQSAGLPHVSRFGLPLLLRTDTQSSCTRLSALACSWGCTAQQLLTDIPTCRFGSSSGPRLLGRRGQLIRDIDKRGRGWIWCSDRLRCCARRRSFCWRHSRRSQGLDEMEESLEEGDDGGEANEHS